MSSFKKIIILALVLFCLASFFGGCRRYEKITMLTDSMAPTIYSGETVFVDRSISIDEIKPGDIIVYREDYPSNSRKDNYTLIVHRLVSKTDEFLIAKCDSNNSEDEPIPFSAYYGKVVKIITSEGKTIKIS